VLVFCDRCDTPDEESAGAGACKTASMSFEEKISCVLRAAGVPERLRGILEYSWDFDDIDVLFQFAEEGKIEELQKALMNCTQSATLILH
jgi:hypothetical protein